MAAFATPPADSSDARLHCGPVDTSHAVAHCLQDPAFRAFVMASLERHARGDDGDLSDHDREANRRERAENCGRVLSVYAIPTGVAASAPSRRVYIITEPLGHPEVRTTVLFPSDY